MGGLAGPVEGDDDGQSDSHFRRRNGDDEEHQNLRIIILVAVDQSEAGKGDEREIGGIEHHFQAHEDHDDAASKHDATESDGKKQSAGDEIVGECRHDAWQKFPLA